MSIKDEEYVVENARRVVDVWRRARLPQQHDGKMDLAAKIWTEWPEFRDALQDLTDSVGDPYAS